MLSGMGSTVPGVQLAAGRVVIQGGASCVQLIAELPGSLLSLSLSLP